jgi:hypothetical protein
MRAILILLCSSLLAIGCGHVDGTRSSEQSLVGDAGSNAPDAPVVVDGPGSGSDAPVVDAPVVDVPDADGGCVLECETADLYVLGVASSYAEPEYDGPWDLCVCDAFPSMTCSGDDEIVCDDRPCAFTAPVSTLADQPKADPTDLGDLAEDPKSVIAIINLGTKEISGVIEYKKNAGDKPKKMEFKVPAGKAHVISLGENAKDYNSVKVEVVNPKGQLYKQTDWVNKTMKWKVNGTAKSGELPILPVYSKDP